MKLRISSVSYNTVELKGLAIIHSVQCDGCILMVAFLPQTDISLGRKLLTETVYVVSDLATAVYEIS